MKTPIKPDNLALAGLKLDKPMLLRVARILLADLYWDEDQEGEYRAKSHTEEPFHAEIMNRPETPQIPDVTDAIIRMAHICGRIEQAWGESFYSVARRLTPPDQIADQVQEDIVYYTIMACIGHGIDANCIDRIDRFDDNLDPSPIRIENPMLFQLSLLE